jgi:uncharacterized membrane protein YhhN
LADLWYNTASVVTFTQPKTTRMATALQYVYLLLSLIDIYAEATGNHTLRLISKPLLMPALIGWFVMAAGPLNRIHKLFVAAFIFSWGGDVALMFVPVNPNYFLLGLVSFLITHILYTVGFAGVTNKTVKPLLPQRAWVLTPLVLYLVVLLSLLLPAINNNPETKPVLIPVIVYTTAIGTMVVYSINRYKRVGDTSFALVFGGALLFMVSDSCIAINRFLQPVPMAGVIIMALYLGGQYLIGKGMLEQFAPNKN